MNIYCTRQDPTLPHHCGGPYDWPEARHLKVDTLFPELPAQLVAGSNSFFFVDDVKLTNNIFRAGLDYRFGFFSP